MNATETKTLTNVTLYTKGDPMCMNIGNIRKIECRTLKIEIGPYAQYENAIKLTWIAKGQRREREMVQTSFPDAVILTGHGHVDPDSAHLPERPGATPGVMVSQSRYRSCDSRWQGDFDVKLAAYLETSGAKIAADYRSHEINPRTSSY
jgi:hypothetical protein